jgi:hypothetical protein
MLNHSFAPAKRALIFFGCMGAVVGGLTLGSGFQIPTDQSSTTVAMARGTDPAPTSSQVAAVNRNDRAESAAKRAIPSPSQQAMAEKTSPTILR